MGDHVSIIASLIYGFVFIAGLMNTIFPRHMWLIFEGWKATYQDILYSKKTYWHNSHGNYHWTSIISMCGR